MWCDEMLLGVLACRAAAWHTWGEWPSGPLGISTTIGLRHAPPHLHTASSSPQPSTPTNSRPLPRRAVFAQARACSASLADQLHAVCCRLRRLLRLEVQPQVFGRLDGDRCAHTPRSTPHAENAPTPARRCIWAVDNFCPSGPPNVAGGGGMRGKADGPTTEAAVHCPRWRACRAGDYPRHAH